MKVGDIVQLKSGGPRMTVGALGSGAQSSQVMCQWFHDTHAPVQSEQFSIASLKVVK